MKVITDPSQLHEAQGRAFVPTMGALHEGHAALIRLAAMQEGPYANAPVSRGAEWLKLGTVVSIFVNPTQFNDPADLARYPRTLEADLAICEASGADAVFAPTPDVIYPPGITIPTPLLPPAATEPKLEDALRPGHFAGVCQVVSRLFELVKPAAAIFGEKDYQQLAVIRAMSAQFFPNVKIIPAWTVREPDGLAMSSRNRFIPAEKRTRAAAISKALCEASNLANDTPQKAEAAMRRTLLGAGFAEADIQYAVVRDAETLTAPMPGKPCRALIAAELAPVRLIDNAPWGGGAWPGR